MSALCAIIAALLMMGASGWCCYRITTREDTPLPLTTWLIFSLVVPAVALAAALQTGLYQWGNAQMVVDAVSVACVLGVMLRTGHYRWALSRWERRSNIASVVLAVVAVIYWVATGGHHYANLTLQGVMVVSYVPVWIELATARRNPYRFGFWLSLAGLSVISFQPAYEVWTQRHESAALWYAGRATACTVSVLLLMWRLRRKEQRNL
jgi:hypothetical protein